MLRRECVCVRDIRVFHMFVLRRLGGIWNQTVGEMNISRLWLSIERDVEQVIL